MTEDERHVSCDEQALGKALGTRPATVHDVAYGEGHMYSAGHGAARLEIYPQTRVTRLTAADMRVELFRNAAASVAQTGVEFHRSQPDQEASLTVLPGGGVVFTFIAGSEPTSASLTGAEVSPRSGQTDRHPAPAPQPATEPPPDTTDPPIQSHPRGRRQPLHRRSGQSPPRPHHGRPARPQATLRQHPTNQGQSKLPGCS